MIKPKLYIQQINGDTVCKKALNISIQIVFFTIDNTFLIYLCYLFALIALSVLDGVTYITHVVILPVKN